MGGILYSLQSEGGAKRKGRVILFAVVIAVVAADQVSKLLVKSLFVEHEIMVLIPHVVNITFVWNRGGAFGILARHQYLFIILSVIAIIAIILFYQRSADKRKGLAVGVGLILGGAVGNLIDRTLLYSQGGVIDWIDIHLCGYHWPAFNIADSAICVGVGLMIWMLGRRDKSSIRADNSNG